MKAKAPTISYGDSYTVGQIAQHWQKSHHFVRRMIEEGKLVVDERGLVSNESLHEFYREHALDLDA
ncbi:MAG: hypothetical protein V9G04_10185 [Nocardioides sp.]|jgi:hypothetical protein